MHDRLARGQPLCGQHAVGGPGAGVAAVRLEQGRPVSRDRLSRRRHRRAADSGRDRGGRVPHRRAACPAAITRSSSARWKPRTCAKASRCCTFAAATANWDERSVGLLTLAAHCVSRYHCQPGIAVQRRASASMAASIGTAFQRPAASRLGDFQPC